MAINLDVHGNTTPLEAEVRAAVNRIRKIPVKLSIDDKGATQPLGNMRRGADEFTKSMEAANARIIAFGASMAIINGVGNAFKALVRDVVEVEKSLADINVVMDLSTEKLDKFSDGLFKVAKETGQAFKVAADAATEYARQGLGVEESLRRTKDALILTRLTGMDSAEAVKSLTAAMNTYGHQIENTTQLVSKFAAVDVKFAVSAEDFADAISRTGSAAKGAGVDIDELIGIVTAAQQKTARGGKVIGNSLKTIFTRVGRTDTLNQLENLGIAVRDIEGNTLGAKKILTDLANTFDTLSEAQKAQIAQTVGGVFQINVLKAILGDAAKQNGILANATQISANATDEAIQKNEMLRGTIAAMASETGTAIKQLSSDIGEIALAPGIEKVLSTVKGFAENLSGVLGDGESTGNRFATGLLKGIGNIITGPGLVVLVGVFYKLFGQAFKFTKDSLSSLIGITSEAQKQKAIQTSLVDLMGRNANLNKELLRTDIGRSEKEKIILGYLKAQVAEANVLNNISKQLASTLYTKGYGANLTPVRRGRAHGYVPNFAHPEREEAAKGGYAAGNIRSMYMPGEGSIIYNSAEKVKNFKGMTQPAIMPPESSKAGKKYQQAFGDIHGFDPYAAGGYIPNFAGRKTAAEYLENAKNAKTTANLTKIARGGEIGGIDFSKERILQNAAAAELQRRNKGKTTVGRSSDLQKIYNKSGQMVLFAASAQGAGSYAGDRKKNIIYLNPNSTKGDSKFSKTNKTNMVPVNVPYFTIGKNDEERAKNDPKIKNKIEGDLIRQSQKTTNQLVSEIFKQKSIPNVIKSGDVAVTVGNVFEKILMSVQKGVSKEAYDADPPGNALLDIPRGGRDALWDLFGATPLGSLGAEAKIALGSGSDAAHLKSAAEKFYKIDSYKGPGGKKAKAFAPAGKVSGKRGRTKAYGYIPSFAANSWESEPKWKWSMNPDYQEFQKKKNLEELNKRLNKFGNSNITTTGKYSEGLPIARITDPATGTYTDFTHGKGLGEAGKSTSIIYSSRGKKDQKGGAFRNFGILGDFTSKQGGKDRSIYSDFDQINVAAGKSPWAMVLRAFPQLKQRIKPGMVTSGEMNIGYDTLPFNSLRALKMQVSKWVNRNGLQAFLDYSKANLGYNEKNAILGGTSSGELFSIGGLRTRMLTRKDKNYLNDSKVGFAAGGYVPNFANPLSDAIGRERAAGVPVSQIRVGSHGALMNKDNPLGLGVTNTKDEPNGLRDVFGANGYVPNYALNFLSGFGAGRDEYKSAAELQKELNVENKKLLKEQKELNQLKRSGKDVTKRLQGVEKQLTRNLQDQAFASKMAAESTKKMGLVARAGGLTQKAINANQTFSNSAVGRGLSGFGGMGLMMGAPMIAGFLQEGREGETAQERVQRMQGGSYAAGGALMGAGTGAAMGMMFGPIGTAVGGVVGAFAGLVGAIDEAEEAIEKEREQRIKSISQAGSSSQDVMEIISRSMKQKPLAEAKDYDLEGFLSQRRMGGFKASNIIGNTPTISDIINKTGGEGYYSKRDADNLIKTVKLAYPSFDESRIERQTKTQRMSGPSFAKQLKSTALREEFLRQEKADFAGRFASLSGDQKIVGKSLIGDQKEGVFSGQEYAQMIQSLSFEEFAAYKEDILSKLKIFDAQAAKSEKDRVAAIILQLNLQKAQIEAQKASADAQFKIKAEYIKQSNLLQMQEKLMGSFISDKQKAENKYTDSLNKAAKAYNEGAESAKLSLKTGIMQDIFQNPTLEQQLKQKLFERKKPGDVSKQDLTNELAKMDDQQLISILREIKTSEKDINEIIENRSLLYDNQIINLERQQSLSVSQAANEKQINLVLAERKKILDDMSKRMENFASNSEFLSEKGALEKRISASRRQGTGYISEREQLQIQGNDMETYDIPELERRGRKQKEAILKGVDVGFNEDEQKQIMALRGENLDIAEVVKAQREREFKEANKGNKMFSIQQTLETNKDLTDEKFKNSVGGGKTTRQEMQAELDYLITLDKERVKLSEELKEKIDQANRDLKEQNVLNQKNVDAVKEEMLARERMHDRMTGPKAMQHGMQDSFKKMADNADKMRYQIGERIPNLLADGLAQAMQVGLNGAEDIGDAMRQIGINFLQAIQSAFLQHAAHSVVGSMGFNLTKNEGGKIPRYSTGGSVPAMVTDGEYVMSRQAVNKYGGAFMHGLNVRGSAPEKFSQGGLADAFGKLGTYQDSGLGQAFQNLDRGKMNNVYSEMSKAQPRQMTMDRMKTVQMQEKSLQDFFSNPAKAQKGGPDLANKTVLNNLMDNKSIKPNPGSSGLIGNLLGGIFSIITAPFKMIGNIFGGLGRYQGGLIPQDIQKFAEGGGVENGIGAALLSEKEEEPKPGTLISTHGGRRYHSGRKYTKNRMSGFFYSQSGNVGLREDAEGLRNELAKEEAARRAREAKKAKKKQFIMSLVGAAASAGISYGMSGGFSGKSFPEGSKGDFLQKTGRLETNPELGYAQDFSAMVYHGGKINKYASGGHISGKPGIDQIPAMLSEGEYVIRASSARKLGRSRLDQINAGRFYDGGSVSSDDETKQETSSSLGNTNNISISVNVTNGSKTGENSESSITNSGEDNRDQADKQKQMAEKIKEQVVSVIVEEQRPGGLLSKTES